MNYAIEANWQEPEPGAGAYVRKGDNRLIAITAGCPCTGCEWQNGCKATGHECKTFEGWVTTGTTNEVEK